jgi:hypothetical protein
MPDVYRLFSEEKAVKSNTTENEEAKSLMDELSELHEELTRRTAEINQVDNCRKARKIKKFILGGVLK